MPWEHAVVGYVGYSLFCHTLYRDSPTAKETIVVVFASLLPDLIDKPLAWEWGIFPSGYALAHSIFVAVPASIVAILLAWRRGRPRIGWAFAVGYLLHLPADVLPHVIRDGRWPIERILWPVRTTEGHRGDGLRETIEVYLHQYVDDVHAVADSEYAVAVLGLMAFGFLLWVYDGMPVLREFIDLGRGGLRASLPRDRNTEE